MNGNMTELVFILDRSGSMSGLEDDTIGGFNGMLKKQKGVCQVQRLPVAAPAFCHCCCHHHHCHKLRSWWSSRMHTSVQKRS